MFKIFNLKINKQAIIRWKIYIDRARMYIGYINLIMMVVVFTKSLEDNKYGKILAENYLIAIPFLILLFIVFSLVLGYLDSRSGVRKEELRNMSMHNPVQKEILELLKEINNNTQLKK